MDEKFPEILIIIWGRISVSVHFLPISLHRFEKPGVLDDETTPLSPTTTGSKNGDERQELLKVEDKNGNELDSSDGGK